MASRPDHLRLSTRPGRFFCPRLVSVTINRQRSPVDPLTVSDARRTAIGSAYADRVRVAARGDEIAIPGADGSEALRKILKRRDHPTYCNARRNKRGEREREKGGYFIRIYRERNP